MAFRLGDLAEAIVRATGLLAAALVVTAIVVSELVVLGERGDDAVARRLRLSTYVLSTIFVAAVLIQVLDLL